MEGVSDFILVCIAEIGMHLVVLHPCDFHQEAERIAVDHLISLEQGFRVGKWYDLVIFAMSDDKEGVYLGDMVHEVETIVLEGGVRGQSIREQ